MDDNIGTLLSQVARLMRRAFDISARREGVTRPQWQVLSLLEFHAGINQGGLADLLEVEPITLGRMIDRMQDMQMVERRPDPADRRAWRLHLTPKGEAQLKRLRPYVDRTLAAALDGVTPEERDVLKAVLVRMRLNLSPRAPAETANDG